MNETDPHILVIDDDKRLRSLLKRYLSENGFLVATAQDAASARAKLKNLTFDLLIIDVMMPGEDGLSLTKSLRQDSNQPILLLTARSETEERIEGLEAGADDYLSKPFEPKELLLRINAILRRIAPPKPQEQSFRLGNWLVHLTKGLLESADETVQLTSVEQVLLQTLKDADGEICSRDDLAQLVGAINTPRTVDVQVTRLRKKIEPDPTTPRYLQTVRGAGYVLRLD